MIIKRKLLLLLLFSFVFLVSISLISAADSNTTDLQVTGNDEIELDQSDYYMQAIDEDVEFALSDLNQDNLSEDYPVLNSEDKAKTEIIADNVTTFPDEGKIIAKLIDESGNPLKGYNITLDLEHIHRNFVTNETGEVYFDLDGISLGVGNYTGILKFSGDDIYNGSTLNIDVKINVLDTNITADNLTFTYKEIGILSVYLKDSNGNPIGNATIRLSLNPIYESLITNSSGQVDFNLSNKLSTGTFEGYVYFDKTNRYMASSIPIRVTVDKIPMQINSSDITYTYGDEKYLTVTLKDNYGNPISNETVSFKTTANTMTGKTDENGIAKFLMNLAPGSYNATVSFAGNKTHQSNSTTVRILVNALRENDISGKGISNKQFIVNFNGKTKKYLTNANGQIKLPISTLVPKTYKVTINFLGDEKYEQASFNITLVVKKAKPHLFASKKKFNVKTHVKKYKVTLKNNKNKVMKKVKVYLKVKGKTYVVKTNKKGQAIFKLTKLTKKGTYKAIITYKGDKCYKKVVKKANIKVW